MKRRAGPGTKAQRAPSKENSATEVPATPATVATAVTSAGAPLPDCQHATEVLDVHAAVPHELSATWDVTVASEW